VPDILGEVIVKHNGANLMSAGTLLYAKKFDVYGDKTPSNIQIAHYKNDYGPQSMDAYYYTKRMFLLPIILEEMSKIKSWKSAEKNFMTLLAENIRPVWKKTLDDLRALKVEAEGTGSTQVPKYHLLPGIIYSWSSLGTLIGVHRLLSDTSDPSVVSIGCCSAECPTFLCVPQGKDQKLSRCSACRKAQYCSTECQKNDWKTHKRNCHKVVSASPARLAEGSTGQGGLSAVN